MGRVWQAWDEYLHRNVWIKEVTPRGESDPSVPRTLREARAAAKLRHRGIITVPTWSSTTAGRGSSWNWSTEGRWPTA